jgi:hypothetical protein
MPRRPWCVTATPTASDSLREPGSPSSSAGPSSDLGVPDGPVRKELAEGNPVMLADGRTIYWHELARPFLFQAVSNEGETGKILILLNKSPCVSLFHRFQREALANFE